MNNDLPKGWKIKKLGEVISKMGSGVTPKGGRETYLSEGIPLIRSQNVLNGELDLSDVAFISEKQHNKMSGSKLKPNDVLLNITGASIGRSCVLPNDFMEGNVNQHVCIIRTNPNELKPFILSQYFLSINGQRIIDSYQVGGNRQGLNYDQLKSFEIPIPPLPEQQKIAQILSTWDKAIQTTQLLLDKLESRKKGMMQKLLNGTGKKWKISLINEVFERVRDNNKRVNEIPILTISAKQGFLSQYEKFNRVIAGTSLEKYTLLKRNDFSYNKGNSKTFPFGCIYKLNIKEGLVPNVYISFRAKVDVSEDFYQHYFLFGSIDTQLKGIISSGARADGLLNVAWEDFFKLKIFNPPIEQQFAIAKILNTADAEIQETKAYLKTLKQQKKGLMQSLLTGKIIVKANG